MGRDDLTYLICVCLFLDWNMVQYSGTSLGQGALGCDCDKPKCVISSPYIDLKYPILEIIRDYLYNITALGACSFPNWTTWAGEEVGSREWAPA